MLIIVYEIMLYNCIVITYYFLFGKILNKQKIILQNQKKQKFVSLFKLKITVTEISYKASYCVD